MTTGSDNTLLGINAGDTLTTGSNNVILGDGADVDNIARTNVIVIGKDAVSAAFDNSTVIQPTCVRNLGQANVLGFNTATGEVTYLPTPGATNVDNSFRVVDNGDNTKQLAFEVANVTTATTRTITIPDATPVLPAQFGAASNLITNNTYTSLITGTNNIAYGAAALSSATTGNNNAIIGSDAGLSLTTGSNNVAIGYEALRLTTTTGDNIAIGTSALRSNITGSGSTAIGFEALYSSTVSANTAIGNSALRNLTTGAQNVAIGTVSMFNSTTGSNNTAIGDFSFTSNTTGSDNIAIGQNALVLNTTGNRNVVIGTNATLDNAARNGCIELGAFAGFGPIKTTADNQLMIQLGTNFLTDAALQSDLLPVNAAVGAQTWYLNVTLIDGLGGTITKKIPLHD